jgi:GNAT superfamily N-acetyltransferase
MDTELLALFDRYERQGPASANYHREQDGPVVRVTPRNPQRLGWVSYARLTKANADETIERQIAHFRALGINFEWKLFDHDQPPDLQQRLRAHGFAIEEAEGLLVLPVAEAPKVLLEPIQQDVRRLTKPEQINLVQQVEEAVWGVPMPWLHEHLGDQLLAGDETSGGYAVYLAYVDGQPASAAWVYFPALETGEQPYFASLWGGSTLEHLRGRGLYTALLAVRLQEAQRRGFPYLYVDASPMSQPILKKHGFRLLGWSRACEYKVK